MSIPKPATDQHLVTFRARRIDALGITYDQHLLYWANVSDHELLEDIYRVFEHVSNIKRNGKPVYLH